MKFDTNLINEIPIRDVVSRFTDIKRKGTNYVTICPWHEDHTPSLTLYEGSRGNHVHCFACGKHASVITYVMAVGKMDFKQACEWLCREFSIPMDDASASSYKWHVPVIVKKPSPSVKQYSYIPQEYMLQTLSADSSFCKGLMELYPVELVKYVADEYCLGAVEDAYLNADVIFWHINKHGMVCNGKVQRYCDDVSSPRFMHCSRNVVYWLGTKLHKEGIVSGPPVFNTGCLFGEHLLNKYPQATVALVESAKNALVAACEVPQMLWLATGCSKGMKRENLEVLRGRDVIVYPDRDAIGSWKAEAERCQDIANFSVSTFCEDAAPADQAKYDIADYIISKRKRG